MEGTDEKLREKLQETDETNGGGEQDGTHTRHFDPQKFSPLLPSLPHTFLTPISFSLPHVSLFFLLLSAGDSLLLWQPLRKRQYLRRGEGAKRAD